MHARRKVALGQMAIKLQLAGMEYATRGKVCKIESREVWVSDDDMLFLARVLGVEPNELYPDRLLHASHLYDAITAVKASRHGDI